MLPLRGKAASRAPCAHTLSDDPGHSQEQIHASAQLDQHRRLRKAYPKTQTLPVSMVVAVTGFVARQAASRCYYSWRGVRVGCARAAALRGSHGQ